METPKKGYLLNVTIEQSADNTSLYFDLALNGC
jgi:hypothetical protein